ncbi:MULTISPECIES: hypothetical protein [unclassified Azospirillum]|uniref:hypothetical protein n=1 Tax=unclassified Azospirillum TaxID=2630922 RepID=UPI0011B25D37|nr:MULTISPECIES: hypothetical protein [unclassified Azospirillum]
MAKRLSAISALGLCAFIPSTVIAGGWLDTLSETADAALRSTSEAYAEHIKPEIDSAKQSAERYMDESVKPYTDELVAKTNDLYGSRIKPATDEVVATARSIDQAYITPSIKEVANSLAITANSVKQRAGPYATYLDQESKIYSQAIYTYWIESPEVAAALWNKAKAGLVDGHNVVIAALTRADDAKDAIFSTIVFGSVVGVSVAVCSAPAAVMAGPIAGVLAGATCYEIALDVVDRNIDILHGAFFERAMSPSARELGIEFGTALGSIVGAGFGVRHAQAARDTRMGYYSRENYADYRKRADSYMNKAYRANKSTIDPNGIRGKDFHLDHKIPVKCFFELGLPVRMSAFVHNFELIPAAENLSKGSGPC